MRVVVQRVTSASVSVGGEMVSCIERGMCVLVGISKEDTEKDALWLAKKLCNLRLWSEGEQSWKKNIGDIGGEILLVSQFTLHGVLKGNKPSFHKAMSSEVSKEFYQGFVCMMRQLHAEDRVKGTRPLFVS